MRLEDLGRVATRALSVPLVGVLVSSAASAISSELSAPQDAGQGAGGRQTTGEPAKAEEVAEPGMPDLSAKTLLPRGVTPKIDLAIKKGLRYLARTQNRDGSWRSAGGYGSYPVAMSSLAATALAAAGSTTTRGPFAPNVRRAVDFLLRSTHETGLITVMQEESRPMYGHGFATMFLAEIYGMEEDPKRQLALHRVLTKAVKLTARSQSGQGGWLYAPDDNGDEGSVTVTQVQALRSCRNAGIAVPTKVIKKSIQYIADCANPDGGIRYSVRSGGGSRPPITAAACAVLYNAGKYDDPMAEKALKYAKRTLPVSGSGGHHYYSHLYLAQALWQKGGSDWDKYFKQLAAWLVRQQRADGSWQGDGVGTTYGTSIALVILQLPFSYLPIYQR